MKKPTKIQFDMENVSDITDKIVEINQDFYTKKTSQVCGSLRFPIPIPIKYELKLKAGDTCFFCKYSEGYYISFNNLPDAAVATQTRARKLAQAGAYNTLYVCIPPFIKNLHEKPITNVQLIRTKGFQKHEWQIRFLSLDSI